MKNREILTRLLAEKAGYDITTTHGAANLQKDLEIATGEKLSVNTLKRIVGILPYDGELRESTVDILADYLGYKSAKELNAIIEKGSSDFSLPDNYIDATKQREGMVFRIEWAPDRKINIRHKGEGEYTVMESVNSKLRAGDLLKLEYISEGLPFIVKEVIRDGVSLGPYTAASETGVKNVTPI